jgi:predicted PurR-regulated permease PerM
MPELDVGSRPSRFMTVVSVGVVIAGLYIARDVRVPVAVALLLTFLLAPLVHRLEHLRVPRIPAVLLSVFFSFAVLGGIGWLISDQATELAVKIGSYQSDIERKIQTFHRSLGSGAIGKASEAINQMATAVATSQPADNSGGSWWLNRGTPQNPVTVQIAGAPDGSSTFKILGDALLFVTPMGQTVIVVVFVIFMLIQREDIRDRVIRLIGHGRLTVTTRALDDASTRISRYLLAQGGINAAFGFLAGTGLYFIGVPNAPLWGLLCALLRFIPYLGVWIGAIFPIILSMVVPNGYYAARPFLTIGLFVFLEILASNVAEPLLFSSSTGVSPLAILVAAVFWTWLWGGVGLLLSTPLTVLIAVAGKYVPQLEFLDVLLGDQPVLSPPERYYQRLLADDPEEAEDLLEEFAKDRTPVELYSQIILPALQMMERAHRRGVLNEQERSFIAQIMRDQADALYGPTVSKPAEGQSPPIVPRDCAVRIVCIPAQSSADEVAGLMLANLLNHQGYSASSVSADTLASERIDSISATDAHVAVISSMPPNALAHARYLCKRIQTRFPEMRVVVGMWNAEGNLDRLRKRLSNDPRVQLVSQLDEALTAIHQAVQPLLMRSEDNSSPAAPSDPSPQTASSS